MPELKPLSPTASDIIFKGDESSSTIDLAGQTDMSSEDIIDIRVVTIDYDDLQEQLDFLQEFLHELLVDCSKEVYKAVTHICKCVSVFPTSSDEYRRAMEYIYEKIKVAKKDLKPFTVASKLIGCKDFQSCSATCLGSLVRPDGNLCQPHGCTVTSVDVITRGEKRIICMYLTCDPATFMKHLKEFREEYGDIAFSVTGYSDEKAKVYYPDEYEDKSFSWTTLLVTIIIIAIIAAVVVFLAKQK